MFQPLGVCNQGLRAVIRHVHTCERFPVRSRGSQGLDDADARSDGLLLSLQEALQVDGGAGEEQSVGLTVGRCWKKLPGIQENAWESTT